MRGDAVYRVWLGVLLAGAAVLTPAGMAHADEAPPQIGAACDAGLDGAMTLLPDGTTYAACGPSGAGYAWAPAATPFPPNDTWLSYGPPITLHGQGMRNPNLTSGQWTATPRDEQSRCRVTQTTVVEAGVLAPPEVTEGAQGAAVAVQMKPKLFYAELGGDCLWVKD